jgi:hypothetical protein
MQISWETEIAQLLTELSAVQDELFDILGKKRGMLIQSDYQGLTSLIPLEEQLVGKMEACANRRKDILGRAKQEGLPSNSIKSLNNTVASPKQSELGEQISQVSNRSRLLHHESITNWVVIQRTLIHLSQMLEIIATGGKIQPTYGGGDPVNSSGSLVDKAA